MIRLIDVVVGKNRFIVLEKVNSIIKQKGMNFERYDFSTKDPDFHFLHVVEAISTISLFDNPRVVFLYVEDEKEMKRIDTDSLSEIIQNLTGVDLVIALTKRIPQTQKLGKIFKKHANMHIILEKDGFNKENYLRRLLKEKNISMSKEAGNLFVERIGEDYARMESELEKLGLLDKRIEKDDVDTMITQDIDRLVFDLSNALLDKNKEAAFRIYHSLLQQKNDPLGLAPIVSSSLRSIYQIETLVNLGYSNSQIEDMLKMSENQVRFLRSRRLGKVSNILYYLNKLSEMDQKTKLGEVDRFVAFELLMLEIMQ